jgi:RNA polymerase sigma-70 factor (ECF subfamily)
MTTISRNRAIDILRQQNARPESNSVSWDLVSPPPAAMAGHDLEEQVELALQRERVRGALVQLPVEQRQVVALAYFKGYTQQQIADMLQQPLGTVKTRIRLAMNKLRGLLQEERLSEERPLANKTSKSNNALAAYNSDKK